jgi:hypothetical protein
MKKALLLAAVLLSGCGGQFHLRPGASSVAYTLRWKDDGNPGVPSCGTATPKGCLLTYAVEDELGNSLPCALEASATSCTFETTPGTHTFSLTISATAVDGTQMVSQPLKQTVTVPSL